MGGAAGASGTGGAAGSGGSIACAPLGISAPPIAFSADPYAHRAPPELSLTGTPSLVAVAVAEMPVESPVGAAAALRVTGFDPWGPEWPDSLGNGALAPFVAGAGQYVIDRGFGDETISVAYPASPHPPSTYPQGLLFTAGLNLFNGPNEASFNLIDTAAGYHVARFTKMGDGAALTGVQQSFYSSSGGDQHEIILCVLPFGPEGFCVPMVGCGSQPVDADAVALKEGFLVAYSSSRGFGECMNDDGMIGPPNRILTAFVGGPGGGYGPLPVQIEQPDDVVRFVRVIPHSEGAWLVYQFAGLNAEQPPPLMAMRISPDGSVLLDATPVLGGSQFYEEPAVAAIGDQLLVGWVDAFDPSGDAYIMLRVLDDSGIELTQNAYPRTWVGNRLSALGSPDGSHVLIGWTEQSGTDGAGEDQAYVARFTCGWGQI
jgi:hypothetical protein